MEIPVAGHDGFFHVRVFVGIVTGLSVTRLLTGLARFVQHPGREQIYPLHLGWVIFLLLAVVHFWWFEYQLAVVEHWGFDRYFFVIFYAALFFFICAILFPDQMKEYGSFADYFHSRQKWFYGLLAGLFVIDMIDTALKGAAYFEAFGIAYPIRQSLLCALSLVAMFVSDRRFHIAFLGLALVTQVVWIVREFDFFG